MKINRVGVLCVAVQLLATQAKAEISKPYEALEARDCSASSPGFDDNADRMVQNAITEAINWCSDSGGVSEGDLEEDWDIESEDDNRFCRVTGKIICNG